jgi:CRISPR system Cascade subunit CasB
MSEEAAHPFIGYLEGKRDDRGVLAALRRGLGQPPGTVTDMYPYVVPWLPQNVLPRQESVYFMIAALFALHPQEGGAGNMGDQFRKACGSQDDTTAIDRRFTVLLSAHPDDLPFFLRQAVSFLASKGIPIQWAQLMRDVDNWGHSDRWVQQHWARRFWGAAPQPTEQSTQEA